MIATAKHFPGHGDTGLIHKDLPVIGHDSARLHEVELYPFKNSLTQEWQAL
ncbi:MAG: hypothetical protein IPP37_07445 [Saprospiraceae bacterium]|nr:hypothetical protein [Saprospiraceae bacterium]